MQRKLLIVATFSAAVAATVLGLSLAIPMFTAETLLRIERVGPRVIDIESVDGEAIQLGGSDDFYPTQHALLASRRLAKRVLGELSIRESRQFLGTAALPAAQLEDPDSVIDRYLRQLVVEPIGQSRLVKLRFSASDPDLAAQIVNAHAGAFIRDGLELRIQAGSEAAAFLDGSLEVLRRRVDAAREALSEFRRTHDIVSLDDKADVAIDRLEDIGRRLTAAQSDRIAREADLELVRRRAYESLPAVIQNDLIRTLKLELAPLERDYAVLEPTVTPSYFALEVQRSRVEQARRRIDLEIDKVVKGIESEYLAARQRESEVRLQFEREKQNGLRVKDDAVRYTLLKQDVESALGLYDSVRQRGEETAMVRGLPTSNVSVIDEAHARARPSSPRRAEVLILGALLGLLAGLGLALLLDQFTGTLPTPRDVTRRLRLPALGVIPVFSVAPPVRLRLVPRSLRRKDPRGAQDVGIERPPDSVQELYRAIRNDIGLARSEAPPRTLLVCSARAGEGATTTALHLAIAFSQTGAPTLLIDANLRRPRCHEPLRVAPEPGLSELLTGTPAELRALSIAERPLYFLPSGAAVPAANDLLASPRMTETLAKLREQFEHVVIDGPPLAGFNDSTLLATRADAVVLVVDGRKTPWTLVERVSDELRVRGAALLGVILNRTGSPVRARSMAASQRRK